MFAHYAENLSGVALIFKKTDDNAQCCDISYGEQMSVAHEHGVFEEELLNGNRLDRAFNTKAKAWKYEREHRFFASPGKHKLEELGLVLERIYYSERFSGCHDTLNIIKAYH